MKSLFVTISLASSLILSIPGLLFAAEPIVGTILAKDGLAAPTQLVTLEAKLIRKGLLTETGLGGERLELVRDGATIAMAMTGGDGRAFFRYIPRNRGTAEMTVRLTESPRVTSQPTTATLAIWEHRNPIVAVEMASLMEEPSSQFSLPALPIGEASKRRPVPDAAEELGRLTKFYYNVIYVVMREKDSSDEFSASEQARQWLKEHKFPVGYVLAVPSAGEALGAKLEELYAAGWTTLKSGIGRTKAFAEALLQHRLEVVLVPEPQKGEVPRKAKVAKDWKDVRKKL